MAQHPAGKLGSAKLCFWVPGAIGCQQYQLWVGWYQGICEHPKVPYCHTVPQPPHSPGHHCCPQSCLKQGSLAHLLQTSFLTKRQITQRE